MGIAYTRRECESWRGYVPREVADLIIIKSVERERERESHESSLV